MKNLIQFRGLNTHHAWRGLVERLLAKLSDMMKISAAKVVLEKNLELNPAFRVELNLAVPGPDLRASACDHTLQAAIYKAVESVKAQFRDRQSKLAARHKRKMQHVVIPTRFDGARSMRRA